MALRNAAPWTFRPKGLTDAVDGSNAFAGAMASLQNYVPNPSNADQWVARPAAIETTDFATFDTPTDGTALLVLGDKVWGMMSTSRFAQKDEPFCYDIEQQAFIAIGNVTAANTPLTQPTTGDWTPPAMVSSTTGRITITHPGYDGLTTFVGWIDISSFVSSDIAATADGTNVIHPESNVLQAGWQVGMSVSGSGVPADTYIVSIASDGLSVTLNNAVTALASTTGTTYSSIFIDGLAVDVRTLGWAVGDVIVGPGIIVGTRIASIGDDGLSLTLDTPMLSVTGDVTLNQFGVANLSVNVNTLGWVNGQAISGANIPGATTIDTVAVDGLSLGLTQEATATQVGVHLTVTVIETLLVTNAVMTVRGGTPLAPLYGAGNVNGQPFASIPRCVGSFNGRAWYGVENFAVFSDELNPQQVTAASQALQLGDSTDVTAFGGLPLVSQITGGAVQALIVFKGAETLFQITGDAATSDLKQNQIDGSVGSLAPNSICPTTKGLAYIAPDGLRILGFNGIASDPIGRAGSGVHTPFTDCVTPSRIAAAFNNNVLRISVQPVASPGQVFVEYFYDFDRSTWSGPHTFPFTLVRAYYGGNGGDCIGFAVNAPTKLWRAAVEPLATSTFVENGVPLVCRYATVLLPDNEGVQANAMVEANFAVRLARGQTVEVSATAENGTVLDELTISGPAVPPATLWGSFIWGAAPWGWDGSSDWGAFDWGGSPWGGVGSFFRQHDLPWSHPLVFKQMTFTAETAATLELIAGNLYFRYQELGYNLPYGED